MFYLKNMWIERIVLDCLRFIQDTNIHPFRSKQQSISISSSNALAFSVMGIGMGWCNGLGLKGMFLIKRADISSWTARAEQFHPLHSTTTIFYQEYYIYSRNCTWMMIRKIPAANMYVITLRHWVRCAINLTHHQSILSILNASTLSSTTSVFFIQPSFKLSCAKYAVCSDRWDLWNYMRYSKT